MKSKGALGGFEPVGAVEGVGGIGERRDHQAVPIGEHLVVEAGTNARCATREQLLAHLGKPLLGLGVAQRDGAEPVEDIVALEIPLRRHAVDFRKELGVIRAEHLFDLGERPHIELPLLAFAVGVER